MEVTIKKIKKEIPEKVAWRCSVKVFLKFRKIDMTTPVPVSFFKKKLHNFIKKETLAQALSCEICQILKNVYFYRASLVAASEIHK